MCEGPPSQNFHVEHFQFPFLNLKRSPSILVLMISHYYPSGNQLVQRKVSDDRTLGSILLLIQQNLITRKSTCIVTWAR